MGSGRRTSSSAPCGSCSATPCTAAPSPPPDRCAAASRTPRAPRSRSCCRCSPATSSRSPRPAGPRPALGAGVLPADRGAVHAGALRHRGGAGLGDAAQHGDHRRHGLSPSLVSPRRSTSVRSSRPASACRGAAARSARSASHADAATASVTADLHEASTTAVDHPRQPGAGRRSAADAAAARRADRRRCRRPSTSRARSGCDARPPSSDRTSCAGHPADRRPTIVTSA